VHTLTIKHRSIPDQRLHYKLLVAAYETDADSINAAQRAALSKHLPRISTAPQSQTEAVR
jgi:hypothetical protein